MLLRLLVRSFASFSFVSNIQGHNQLVAYSRAAYFCIICTLIWLLEQLLRKKDLPVSSLYGVTLVCYDILHFLRDLLVGEFCLLHVTISCSLKS